MASPTPLNYSPPPPLFLLLHPRYFHGDRTMCPQPLCIVLIGGLLLSFPLPSSPPLFFQPLFPCFLPCFLFLYGYCQKSIMIRWWCANVWNRGKKCKNLYFLLLLYFLSYLFVLSRWLSLCPLSFVLLVSPLFLLCLFISFIHVVQGELEECWIDARFLVSVSTSAWCGSTSLVRPCLSSYPPSFQFSLHLSKESGHRGMKHTRVSSHRVLRPCFLVRAYQVKKYLGGQER